MNSISRFNTPQMDPLLFMGSIQTAAANSRLWMPTASSSTHAKTFRP